MPAPGRTQARRRHAQQYNELLCGAAGIQLPVEAEYAKHVYHLFSILCPRREELMEALADKEIYCGMHYPIPVHLQEAYRFLGLGEGSFPVAENCAAQQVSLPMFAELAPEQVEYACQELKNYLAGR